MTERSQRLGIPEPIMNVLRCPLCAQTLDQGPARLHCPGGHSFDRAKQGYVTLRRGGPTPKNADTPAMVAARETLLGSGLYAPIRDRLATRIAARLTEDQPSPDQHSTDQHSPDQHKTAEHHDDAPLIADLGGGTGYYLAGILEHHQPAYGVCIDLSAAALKRAARCHERAAAIGNNLLADPLPLADDSVTVATSIFGPRNLPEIRRVLRNKGVFAVVTPTRDHLAELVGPLGLVQVDQRKEERLAASLSDFTMIASEQISYTAPVSRDQARALVEMGPSAHHICTEDLVSGLDRLPEDLEVTIAVNLGLYSPN